MEMGMQSVLIVELEYIVARLGFKFSKSSIKDQRYVLNQKQNETRMQTWRKMEHFLAFSTGQNQAWCLRQYPAYCWYRVLNYLKKVHLILWPLCSSTAPAIWKYFMKAHIQETHKMAPISKYKHLWDFSNFEVAEMKKIWAKWKNVVVKRTKKSRNPPLVVSENHHAHIPVRYYLYPLWFYSTGRNNFLLLFCCSHTESSALDSDEALSDDLADGRDCHGFTNPRRSWVWVGKGVGMGWPFTPLEKPVPVAWVSQGFTGSWSAQKKNLLGHLLSDSAVIYKCIYYIISSTLAMAL